MTSIEHVYTKYIISWTRNHVSLFEGLGHRIPSRSSQRSSIQISSFFDTLSIFVFATNVSVQWIFHIVNQLYNETIFINWIKMKFQSNKTRLSFTFCYFEVILSQKYYYVMQLISLASKENFNLSLVKI